jgi:hypothetical protein
VGAVAKAACRGHLHFVCKIPAGLGLERMQAPVRHPTAPGAPRDDHAIGRDQGKKLREQRKKTKLQALARLEELREASSPRRLPSQPAKWGSGLGWQWLKTPQGIGPQGKKQSW